ncbi:UNVERIFIED_CONTAM: hypothetical protein Slati_1777800 [Sesamum latifolium]|uniref:Uncharacterized protein n=1 Tax=Sesamum latifolium TaxID=2727402 RepID=A0AAW2WY24_9LAMI
MSLTWAMNMSMRSLRERGGVRSGVPKVLRRPSVAMALDVGGEHHGGRGAPLSRYMNIVCVFRGTRTYLEEDWIAFCS